MSDHKLAHLLCYSLRARRVIDNGGKAIGVETEQRRGLRARCRPVADAGCGAAYHLTQRGEGIQHLFVLQNWFTSEKPRVLTHVIDK